MAFKLVFIYIYIYVCARPCVRIYIFLSVPYMWHNAKTLSEDQTLYSETSLLTITTLLGGQLACEYVFVKFCRITNSMSRRQRPHQKKKPKEKQPFTLSVWSLDFFFNCFVIEVLIYFQLILFYKNLIYICSSQTLNLPHCFSTNLVKKKPRS